MYPKAKVAMLRAKIREAIRAQNARWRFSCYDCISCVKLDATDRHSPHHCTGGFLDRPSSQLRPAPIVLECFNFGQSNGAFGRVVEWMILNGFNIMEDDHGWATVARRIVSRSTNCGHLPNVSHKNLERFI